MPRNPYVSMGPATNYVQTHVFLLACQPSVCQPTNQLFSVEKETTSAEISNILVEKLHRDSGRLMASKKFCFPWFNVNHLLRQYRQTRKCTKFGCFSSQNTMFHGVERMFSKQIGTPTQRDPETLTSVGLKSCKKQVEDISCLLFLTNIEGLLQNLEDQDK